MEPITNTYSKFHVHFNWAVGLIIAVVIARYWPSIKTWPSKIAAWTKKEEKDVAGCETIVKAEIANALTIGGVSLKTKLEDLDALKSDVEALKAKVETLLPKQG